MKRTKGVSSDYKIDRYKFFDTEERNTLMEHCQFRATDDERKGRKTWPMRWMLVHLAMNSGLRVSEITALTIRDIHFDNDPYIRVRNGKRRKNRDVYIDTELAIHLRRWIWVDRESLDEPLFIGSKGKHYTTTALNRAFHQSVKAAGLRTDLSIHSARHTYATILLYHTGNLRYVQKQLGHASLNMTALYADVLPEQNGQLANMILNEVQLHTTQLKHKTIDPNTPPPQSANEGSGVPAVDTSSKISKKLTSKNIHNNHGTK